ncbi:hypothetical protein [Clostridium sp.]|uniref:hypothetical protein n=1 Tax=Clostridium sp. TaxID=1506 RepID=UPI0034639F0B
MKSVFRILLVFIVTFISLLVGSKKDKISSNNKERLKNIKLNLENKDTSGLDVLFNEHKLHGEIDIGREEFILPKGETLGKYTMNTLTKGPAIEDKINPIFLYNTRLIIPSIKDKILVGNITKKFILVGS